MVGAEVFEDAGEPFFGANFCSDKDGIGSTRIRVRQLTSQARRVFLFLSIKKLKKIPHFNRLPLMPIAGIILFMVPSRFTAKYPAGEEVSFLCL